MTARQPLVRHGPIDHVHARAGADVRACNGATIPWRFASEGDPSQCAIADLSALPRIGFKGWQVWSVLAGKGLNCPTDNNRATVQPDGRLCLRLGDSEALLLSTPEAEAGCELVPADFGTAEGFYCVARSETHAWLLVTGEASPALLSKLCAVDCRLHVFPEFRIAQTSVASVSAIIVRHDRGFPGFHILVDAMSASYMWRELLHASGEFEGGPVGLEALESAR